MADNDVLARRRNKARADRRARMQAYDEALDQGLSREEACARLGIKKNTGTRYETELYGSTLALIAERREDFASLRENGVSLRDCATRLGVSDRTITRYEKRRKEACSVGT